MASSSMVPEAARSVANKELPPCPPELLDKTSLVLFYQYVEPIWTGKEHKEALKYVINLGNKCRIFGRGRCAAEGLNCTLTGAPGAIRAFCMGLREWKPALFGQTDFKITDGLAAEHGFKALTIQKQADLVAYGLPSDVAPALKTSRARHVEADEYHDLMKNPDAVIIDVRNFYESAIGHFQPPPGGATLIDPKMRNSIEFPKWVNAPETQAKLNGKQVLMYCTGGIRCERASALLDALAQTSNGQFEVKDTVMVRGGIERYMKTFPSGGYWKGKNYLFDRRFEQVPEAKSEAALSADVESYCCVCRSPCGYYRGQFHCAGWLEPTQSKCYVPVIVCQSCAARHPEPKTLFCPLCEDGFHQPQAKPDLEGLKAQMRQTDPVVSIRWLTDRSSGLFYGAAFVQMRQLGAASALVQAADRHRVGAKACLPEKQLRRDGDGGSGGDEGGQPPRPMTPPGLRLRGRWLRVHYAPLHEAERWPPEGSEELERPPVGGVV